MSEIYQLDLDTALSDWLAARERFLSGSGRDALDRFDEANQRLFVAFVEGWMDVDEEVVTQTFAFFRKWASQRADADKPERVRFHPCPVAPALA